MSAHAPNPALASAAAAAPARRLLLPVTWLISPAADLVWLIGSVAVSYAMFFLWRAGLLATTHLYLIWIFVFHGPHFWATLSRTFLDPAEHAQRGGVLRRSLLWFLVGPAVVGAGLLVKRQTGMNDVGLLFFFFAGLWAYHHVVKQHFGFMALYRAKSREFDKTGFLLHRWYLVVSLWAPAVIVLSNSYQWLEGTPLVAWYGKQHGAQPILDAGAFLARGSTVVFFAAQALFVGMLLWRVVSGRGINLPETLVVLACVPLHWFVVRAALEPGRDPVAFVPLVTTYHNIQYHGLLWHYNKTKYHAPGALERHGAAARLNRNFLVYFLCGVVYTTLTIGIESYGIYDLSFLARSTALGELTAAFIWGVSFMHYYLDQKIWHVREDAALRRVLGFPEPPQRQAAVAAAPAAATA